MILDLDPHLVIVQSQQQFDGLIIGVFQRIGYQIADRDAEGEWVAIDHQTRFNSRIDLSFDPVIDHIPTTWKYRNKTELGLRLQANQCEWCGTQQGPFEVHHIRKLSDLNGKSIWEKHMIARQRKTMVLCKQCHVDLHAGRLNEAPKLARENRRAGYAERCLSGSEGSSVKPILATA